ncbi:MAG: CGLD27 family protein [Synechococcales bacterium]|nr:CGLD27 family protein [Synechococcales bacterium]
MLKLQPVEPNLTNPPLCPVPTDQQPLMEYQNLRESWFFDWGFRPLKSYFIRMIGVCCLGCTISAPVAAASFSPGKHPIHFLFATVAGFGIITLLLWIRLYLGWQYVGNRLNQETIFYEESGWYDGQNWQKSPLMLSQDRLVFQYQVQPLLHRLHLTIGVMVLVMSLGYGLWFVIPKNL